LTHPGEFVTRSAVPLTLSPAMAERFSRIIALLCEIVAEQGVRQRRDGRLTILIYNRIRHLARRFLARATVPPGPRENAPRAPASPPHTRPQLERPPRRAPAPRRPTR